MIKDINTHTIKLIVLNEPNSAFELNNLIGKVGRLNLLKLVAGEVIFKYTEDESKFFNKDQCINFNFVYEDD